MRLTNSGKIFLAIFLLFYWAAIRTTSGLLFLVLGVLAGSFLIDTKEAIFAGRGCKVKIKKKLLFQEGETLKLPFKITTPSQRERTIFIEENFSAQNLNKKSLRRGIYPLHNIIMEHSGALGLVSLRKRLKIDGKLVVTPKIFPTNSPPAGGLRSLAGGKNIGSSPCRAGSTFRSTRPYHAEDSLTRIHWPATAKRGELMVKEFDEERAGYVTLWLDVSPLPGSDSVHSLDAACRMAASLAFSALEEKHRVEFVVLGEDKILSVDLFLGMDELLEKLAGVKFKTYNAPLKSARKVLNKLPPSSSHNFILLTPREETSNFISGLALERKKVTVYD